MGLSTLNLVLTIVLTAMIGFAIGNAYGQTKMKMILNDLIKKMTDGIRSINDRAADKKGDAE